MYKHLIISLSMCCMALAAYSQNLNFISDEYDMIEPMSDDCFRYRQNNKVGILKSDGTLVQEWTADYITAFHDGMALVLVKRDGRYRLHRLVDIDLEVRDLEKDMFVDAYPFYSGGYLPVYTKTNRTAYGFIDRYGSMVLKDEYPEIKPCISGKALVVRVNSNKSDKWYEVNLSKQDGSGIKNAAKDIGGFFGINTISIPKENAEYYSSCEDRKDILTYLDNYHYKTEANGLKAFKDDDTGLYGYKDAYGYVAVPSQFKFASDFINETAAVTLPNGKARLMRLQGKPARLISSYVLDATGNYTFRFHLILPSEVQKKVDANPSLLTVRCLSEYGIVEMPEHKGINYYEFRSGSKKKTVEVIYDGLVVARQNLEKESVEIVDLKLSASRTSVRANVNDRASVQFTVFNPGSTEVTFEISSSGKSANLSETTMTVAPNSSVNFTASYYNINTDTSSTITISGNNILQTSVRVQLSTYF